MRSLLCLALALGLSLAVPAAAQVQGVGYRIAPSGAYVAFDGDAGLSDGLLYGGGGGLSFGEFLELNGAYLVGTGFETDYSDFSGTEDDPALQDALASLAAREVGVRRYGGSLKLNLGTGAVVPFLNGGAGVIRFDPDGQEASKSLYLLAGAGLQFAAADRYTLSIAAEGFAYRYNPGTTFFSRAELNAAGLGLDDFNEVEVLNPSVRAALQLYLGGRRPGAMTALDREFQRQFSGGLSGLSLVVEPFYARTEFDPAFNYSDQSFAGVEAGFDVGPLVGLRGFYGRGVESGDPTTTEGIQMYGGDVRMRLNAGDGFVPFLSVGAGYLDVMDDYADVFDDGPDGVDRALAEDRPFATGGVGIELPFGPRLRAVGEVRALAMSTQDEGDVSRPDDVFLSPSYRVGLSLGLGGTTGRAGAMLADDLAAERARLEAELAVQRAETEAAAAIAQIEAETQLAELQREVDEARAAGDAAAVTRLEAERAALASPTPAPTAQAATAQPGRTITIPVPEVGELYVRYGPPGGVAIESVYADPATAAPAALSDSAAAPPAPDVDVRAAVREALREALDASDTGALTGDDLDALERRLQDRIADRLDDRDRRLDDRRDDGLSARDLDALERRLEERMAFALRAALAERGATPVVVTPDGQVVTPAAPTADGLPTYEAAPALRRQGLYSLSPTLGLGFGRTGNAVVGLRAEYASGTALTYLPELLVSVAGRRSFAANLDAAFSLPSAGFDAYGMPYGRIGVGLINVGADDAVPDTFDETVDDGGTALTLNLGLGANLAYGGGRFFADFTTGNFGRYNRLTAGYRFPFGSRGY
ncbi:outer membrane beta-barrel protein [Rubrivirga sp. IMCC45206]|uniref:outer membrane beta-barrel protein n=1 Tax=Rubrivirga sp. IMCC45206 TaxID=3391614 RepID=UPI00398FB3F0